MRQACFSLCVGEQRREGAGVSAAREQLIAIDQVEERHRLLAQRMNDVTVVDDMAALVAISLAAVGLFAITLIPDILDKYRNHSHSIVVDDGQHRRRARHLAAMMGAVATVLALIFSVALLVLSMVSTLFGPRLLYRFLQDSVTQVTIGLFMGTFVYICLVFLVTHRTRLRASSPISLIMAWVLVVISFGSWSTTAIEMRGESRTLT